MQNGGCLADGDGRTTRTPARPGTFHGRQLPATSPRTCTRTDTGKTVFPAVKVKKYDGVKVGFIGMTLENTPNIVTRSGVAGPEVLRRGGDRQRRCAEAANRNGREVDRRAACTRAASRADPTAYNACPGISGPIVDINKGLSPRIDAVVTGHTHQAYNCKLKDPNDNRRLVTSGVEPRPAGHQHQADDRPRRPATSIRPSETAGNRIVTRDVAKRGDDHQPDHEVQDAGRADREQGHRAPRRGHHRASAATPDDSGDSPLGNLIADAQKADPSAVTGRQDRRRSRS